MNIKQHNNINNILSNNEFKLKYNIGYKIKCTVNYLKSQLYVNILKTAEEKKTNEV